MTPSRLHSLVFFLLFMGTFSLWGVPEAFSQSLWWVTFADKPGNEAICAEDWDPKALARRERMGIAFPAWEDLPVNEAYVEAVSLHCDSLRYTLRWLNAVTISATEEQVELIRKLPFVKSVDPFGVIALQPLSVEEDTAAPTQGEREILLGHQRRLLGLDTLAAHHLDGSGVRIAVLDAGFKDLDEHEAAYHVFEKGRIIAQKDFYGNKPDVFYHSYHGTSVVSAIAGKWKGVNLGAAPEAEFLLARTEHLMSEKIIEEDHWFAAMEWADQNGADIISSSLGYSWKRYEWKDLDGLSSRVTNAARIAVRKGIFVVNSIGNEGSSKHNWLSAPSDADSVCAVGGSYPMIRYAIPFTSFGPNSRGIVKPDVAAPAYVLTAKHKGEYITNAGTSFSAPLVSGFVACMMQLHPQKTNVELLQLLRETGHYYPYFDYRLGYGVPDAKYLFHARDTVPPTLQVQLAADSMYIVLDRAVVDAKDDNGSNGKPIYFHLQGPDGRLSVNYEFRVEKGEYALRFPARWPSKYILRVWFEGYLYEKRVNL